jgi:hypothetical protein
MRLSKTVATAEATPMLPTEDLFLYVYVLIDDLINASASAALPAQLDGHAAVTGTCT